MPNSLQVDNGPEFAGKMLDLWAYFNHVTLDFSPPGKPTDNAFIESFNGRLRQECLDPHRFTCLDDLRAKTEHWRREYNEDRPHSALGNLAPPPGVRCPAGREDQAGSACETRLTRGLRRGAGQPYRDCIVLSAKRLPMRLDSYRESRMSTDTGAKPPTNTVQPNGQPSPTSADRNRFFSTNTERGRFHIATSVAILVPIITPILTVLVVTYQLNQEHNFVDGQRQLAREQARLDEKIRLQTKVASLVPTSTRTRQQLAVTQVFRNLTYLALEEEPNKLTETFNKFADKTELLGNQFRSESGELAGALTAARHYYGADTRKAIDEFGAFLNTYQQPSVPDDDELKTAFAAAKKKGIGLKQFFEEWSVNAVGQLKGDKYNELGMKVIDAMIKEVADELNAEQKPGGK